LVSIVYVPGLSTAIVFSVDHTLCVPFFVRYSEQIIEVRDEKRRCIEKQTPELK